MSNGDLRQKERESLFANEGFAISMQQVVAGGLLLGVLAKWKEAADAVGPVQLLIVVAVAGIALIAAVLAAQFRHDYRMWNVKALASGAADNASEAHERGVRADRNLWRMRYAMWTATIAICLAVAAIVAGAWSVTMASTIQPHR